MEISIKLDNEVGAFETLMLSVHCHRCVCYIHLSCFSLIIFLSPSLSLYFYFIFSHEATQMFGSDILSSFLANRIMSRQLVTENWFTSNKNPSSFVSLSNDVVLKGCIALGFHFTSVHPISPLFHSWRSWLLDSAADPCCAKPHSHKILTIL